MSFRARRVTKEATVVAFPWDGGRGAAAREAVEATPEPVPPDPQHLADVERDAYAKGFAQGEAEGLETASRRGQATLERLTRTLEDLGTVRNEMIRQTERQMVDLAIAVARRIVHREVAADQELIIAMARVALERLGDGARVTVRLHPDEYEATGAGRHAQKLGTNVMVLADPRVEPGGCRIESDLGMVDAGVDAQIQEITRILLSEERREPHNNVVTISGHRRADAAESPESEESEIVAERKPA